MFILLNKLYWGIQCTLGGRRRSLTILFWKSLLHRYKCQTTIKVVLRSGGEEKMKRRSDISWSLAWKREKYWAEVWQTVAFKDFLSQDNYYKPPSPHLRRPTHFPLRTLLYFLWRNTSINLLQLPLTHHHIYKDSFTGSSIHSNWDIDIIIPLKLFSIWSQIINCPPHQHFSEFPRKFFSPLTGGASPLLVFLLPF